MSIKKYILSAVLLMSSSVAIAADCSVTVEASDSMQFNTKEIAVSKTCKDFTIDLKNVGKMPKQAMGHNIVIVKKADMKDVAMDGAKAGPASNYLKAGDTRVVAATKIIGGGESDKITFPVSKLESGAEYGFFCSFPGHMSIMQGTVKLVN